MPSYREVAIPDWITTQAAGDILGTDAHYIWELIHKGYLPEPVRIAGGGGCVLHSEVAIRSYLREHPNVGKRRRPPVLVDVAPAEPCA